MKYLRNTVFIFLFGFCIALLVILLLRTPTKFVVINDSDESILVTAYWLNEQKELGKIAAKQEVNFFVNEEAGMKFKATFSDAQIITSEEIYFTSGAGNIEARVTRNAINMKYLFENERP